MQNIDFSKWTTNKKLVSWIKDKIDLCKPKNVHLCDGSKEEINNLITVLEKQKKVVRLNTQKRPNSFYFRSNPDDVARVEEATFICSEKEEDAGPTNNWKEPKEMKQNLLQLFDGCMKGRTMYVIVFSMGPLSSDKSMIGVEITDSEYVVCNMDIMSRMGKKALEVLKDDGEFIPCMHSVGVPLQENQEDVLWPCNPKKRCIVHFPKERSIWSFGSGYGGNALLGKKCLALRIASIVAKEEGWLAEHMLILAITNPEGKKKYIAAAFPSACGKTNLAMMQPTLPGWKIECVGDDIAWMKFAEDGRLYAINPEAGFFGVAPGTSADTNPNAVKTLEKDSIFTNVALTEDNDVWWEGMKEDKPQHVTSWLGEKVDTHVENKNTAHPNSRFTARAKNCPVIAKEWEDPKGVPISAIIFGGRRDDTIPLIFESFDWKHGVFLGTSASSQMTAAAKGTVGKLRHDPFAMLPFCGYNMGDYFNHWFSFEEKSTLKKLKVGSAEKANFADLPKIYYVNWFIRNEKNEFIWPGFGENVRVLKWIFERCENKVGSMKTPIGNIPKIKDFDITNLNLSYETLEKLFKVDIKLWEKEIAELEKYFSVFKERLPEDLKIQLDRLKTRIENYSYISNKL